MIVLPRKVFTLKQKKSVHVQAVWLTFAVALTLQESLCSAIPVLFCFVLLCFVNKNMLHTKEIKGEYTTT